MLAFHSMPKLHKVTRRGRGRRRRTGKEKINIIDEENQNGTDRIHVQMHILWFKQNDNVTQKKNQNQKNMLC